MNKNSSGLKPTDAVCKSVFEKSMTNASLLMLLLLALGCIYTLFEEELSEESPDNPVKVHGKSGKNVSSISDSVRAPPNGEYTMEALFQNYKDFIYVNSDNDVRSF